MAGWWRRLLEKRQRSPCATSDEPRPSAQLSETPLPQPSVPLEEMVGDVESIRWSKDYDVCICHSEEDLSYALDLESYLVGQPEAFRCFLQLRDSEVGGAIPTELCNALANSHCWVLLVTQGFLQDPWCRYQMNQALAQSPMANGRIIPLVKDLDHAQYPQELKFMYNIKATMVKVDGFERVKRTLLGYFKELRKSERSSAIGNSRSSHSCSTTTGQCTTANCSSGESP